MEALGKAVGDAATIVEQASQSAAKSANTAVGGLVDQLGGEVEVESAPTPAPTAADPTSFGSPAPPSPLDGAAKLLDFENAKPVTPQPAQSPPTPTMAPLSPAPVAAAATQPLPVTPATPLPTTASSAAAAAASSVAGSSGATAEGPIDYASFIEDTLLWVNKVRSVVYLLGGLLAVYLVHRLLTSGVTLVTGVAWLLLAQAALNFVRGFINPKLQARCTWQDSALTSLLLQGVSNAVKGAAALHDKHLTSPDAGKLLRIVVVLWGVSLAGRLVGATGLAAALWVLAFSVPKAYLLNKSKVDSLASDAFAKAKAQFVKLDPKVRAAVVVLPTFIAGYLLSRADLSIALLALALYGRSLMAQSQVDKVNAAVAPVSNTVVKVGDTVGNVLQSAVAKYELTPTPAKKKRE